MSYIIISFLCFWLGYFVSKLRCNYHHMSIDYSNILKEKLAKSECARASTQQALIYWQGKYNAKERDIIRKLKIEEELNAIAGGARDLSIINTIQEKEKCQE